MNLTPLQQAELRDLIDAVCEAGPTSPTIERLESLLLADDDACRYYLDYAYLHGALLLATEPYANEERTENDECGMRGNDECGMMNDELPESTSGEWRVESGEPSIQHSAFSIQHLPIIDTSSGPSPLPSFLDSMLFSNLVATLLMGVGLLAAWAWKIPTPVQIAVQSPPATKDKAVPEPKTEYIGRITGMIDVKWSDATTAAVTEFVELGRKYALASGLMEITYDSGARVILQGPCTYEAESAAGGYLSVGKLTARLEKKNDELRTEQNDIHPSSFILHPLFSVRTPTATVTDLGTEFGVDVASSGTVETMVLSGSVRVATAELHGNTGAIRVLHTGEAVRVDAREGMTSIEAITVPKDRFVRSIQAFHRSILIGPNIYNGSFEHPAVGPGNSTGSNLSYNVYFKTGEVAPWHWNPVASLQTKGTLVRGVSGWQYVVLQPPTLLLSTTFDGTMGHPTLRKFELHTKYVLSADVGGNIAGVNGIACLENGEHTLRMVFKVTDANLMQPTTLELDTNVHPEFIGNPITVSFTNTTPENQLFIDNVVLMAIPAPATPNEPI